MHKSQNPLHLKYIMKVIASCDTMFKHVCHSERTIQCEDLRRKSFLWLHCIDLESRFELTVKSFPLLKLKFVYGHFSFMRNLSEQRLVVFLDSNDVLMKFAGVKSPCCIEVKSSAIFCVSME